jgi:tRNA-2-methylthio-N6-dimethylallyladenosine synthase
MTDHIVVFDGPERLVGQTVRVHIDDATAFTLFGTVATGEVVGVACEREPAPAAADAGRRIGLPLI